MKITTKRLAPGYYEVTNGKRTVEVYRREERRAWIARATWDRYLYTDLVDTKREAVEAARWMIEND